MASTCSMHTPSIEDDRGRRKECEGILWVLTHSDTNSVFTYSK